VWLVVPILPQQKDLVSTFVAAIAQLINPNNELGPVLNDLWPFPDFIPEAPAPLPAAESAKANQKHAALGATVHRKSAVDPAAAAKSVQKRHFVEINPKFRVLVLVSPLKHGTRPEPSFLGRSLRLTFQPPQSFADLLRHCFQIVFTREELVAFATQYPAFIFLHSFHSWFTALAAKVPSHPTVTPRRSPSTPAASALASLLTGRVSTALCGLRQLLQSSDFYSLLPFPFVFSHHAISKDENSITIREPYSFEERGARTQTIKWLDYVFSDSVKHAQLRPSRSKEEEQSQKLPSPASSPEPGKEPPAPSIPGVLFG
jgi:hypothetical protein